MRQGLERLVAQPIVGIVTAGVALFVFVSFWGSSDVSVRMVNLHDVALAACLGAVVALSYRFPIHVLPNTKIYMGSVALYLLAVLLSPLVGGIAAALGVTVGNRSVQKKRGLYLSDVVTDGSRWALVSLAGSSVAHAHLFHGAPLVLPYAAAGVSLWLGDLLTTPLLDSPMSGSAPWSVISMVLHESGVVEAAQYLVGLMGALAATQGQYVLALLLLPTVLIYWTFRNSKVMHDSTRTILNSMADAVDLRDQYTGGHSRRVAELAAWTLEEMGKYGPEADLIVAAGRVHDIGKIGIPDHILLKCHSLTPEEWAIMKTHTERGAELLRRYPDFARGADIIRHHHERWDGAGYPDGLKGSAIPLGARVIAVADSFDTMTSDRPYRTGMSVERAALLLREGRGRQWDPTVVDAFLRVVTGRVTQPTAFLDRIATEIRDSSSNATG